MNLNSFSLWTNASAVSLNREDIIKKTFAFEVARIKTATANINPGNRKNPLFLCSY